MSIEIDFAANAAYVALPAWDAEQRRRHPHQTVQLTPGINVDGYGTTIGVEVIGLQTEIPIGRLVKEYDVPDVTIRELLSLASASASRPTLADLEWLKDEFIGNLWSVHNERCCGPGDDPCAEDGERASAIFDGLIGFIDETEAP